MDGGFRPSLAIVFISVKQDRNTVRQLLDEKGITVFGATSCGEFIDGHQSEGGIAILLLEIPRDRFSLIFEEVGNRSIEETSKDLSQKAAALFTNPSLLICSTGIDPAGSLFDGFTLVRTVKETLGADQVFAGGLAGDDMTFSGSYIFTNDRETAYGVAAIVLDADRIDIRGMAITGWQPMGIARTVTKSTGNRVYEIDGIPAVDMYLLYLGQKDYIGGESLNLMSEISLYYPFLVERPGGGIFLHTPLSIDVKEKALQLDVPMPEGTRFHFSTPPDFDIVDEVIRNAERIKENETADALLVFSCAGRINVLGPMAHTENEGLHEVWKAPMAGFFTYGEFGRDEKNNQEFHSGACSWVALKEK